MASSSDEKASEGTAVRGSDTRGLSAARVRSLLELGAESRVLVVGDCMVDRYLVGSVDRISPEAPVPVVRVEDERTALGGAANVAAGVVALGGACRLAGVVGGDAWGERMRAHLKELDVGDDAMVTDGARPTTLKTRILARHQQMLRVDRETTEPLSEEGTARLRERVLDSLEWATCLVLEDYDKGVLAPELVTGLLEEANRREVPSVIDPKLRRFFDYRGAHVFKPNGRELAAAEGKETPPRARERLRELRRRLGCRNLLVTLGEEGMLLVDEEERRHVIRAHSVEVYDVSGAGDTVTAVLGALVPRAPVLDAARLANVAAGIGVTRLGAVPVSREEILARLDAGEAGAADPGEAETEREDATKEETWLDVS